MAASVASIAGAIFAGIQIWQAHRAADPDPQTPPPGALPAGQVDVAEDQGVQVGSGNVMINQFLTPPAAPGTGQAALVVVGEIPQEPLGWRPRPELMAALGEPGPGSRVVVRAVTGMRGVGKTQLAAAYARTRLGTNGGRLAAWINAETHGGLLAGLADTAEALGLPADDAEAAGIAVRHWLEADGSGCLLVLDNVTDPEVVQPYLPAGGEAQVVITSNHQSVAALGTALSVEVFTESEGLAYLTHRTGLTDTAGARDLGAELGWLPLALTQAAAVIAARHMDYPRYLRRLRRVPVADLLTPVVAGQYPRGVVASVLLSLDAVTDGDSSGLCAQQMEVLAVLSPSGVSRALASTITAVGSSGVTPPAGGLAADAADDALGRLAEASLLTFTIDGATIVVHRLVQRVIRDQVTASGGLADVCLSATTLLDTQARALEPVWHENRAAVRDLTGQILALHQLSAACPHTDRLTRSLLQVRRHCLWFLNALGDSAVQATVVGESLVADEERAVGPDHPDTLASRNMLANAYRDAGRIPEAIALHERTLADRERTLGPDHPQTLASRNNLATAYQDADRADDAVTLLERTLADMERSLGPDHPDTLASSGNLALAYQEAGRPGKAVALHERTLADRERTLGPDHPHTLASRSSLASAYQDACRNDEAIILLERTLADSERALGPDHPHTLISRHNLALAYQEAGRTDQAVALHERTLADRERTLGPDHPDTLQSRSNLADARRAASAQRATSRRDRSRWSRRGRRPAGGGPGLSG